MPTGMAVVGDGATTVGASRGPMTVHRQVETYTDGTVVANRHGASGTRIRFKLDPPAGWPSWTS
jgi:hypothetical protein